MSALLSRWRCPPRPRKYKWKQTPSGCTPSGAPPAPPSVRRILPLEIDHCMPRDAARPRAHRARRASPRFVPRRRARLSCLITERACHVHHPPNDTHFREKGRSTTPHVRVGKLCRAITPQLSAASTPRIMICVWRLQPFRRHGVEQASRRSERNMRTFDQEVPTCSKRGLPCDHPGTQGGRSSSACSTRVAARARARSAWQAPSMCPGVEKEKRRWDAVHQFGGSAEQLRARAAAYLYHQSPLSPPRLATRSAPTCRTSTWAGTA
eukprot:COSAG06_NODE_110_length_23500_cov_328.629204_12_plen_266_part_00